MNGELEIAIPADMEKLEDVLKEWICRERD